MIFAPGSCSARPAFAVCDRRSQCATRQVGQAPEEFDRLSIEPLILVDEQARDSIGEPLWFSDTSSTV
ncbi:hypothetical protein DBV08_27230 [Rhodococcus sp. KBW08]|nr:hypothetical protein DBV08_27230 [Rhodococcus sp. KBW08]